MRLSEARVRIRPDVPRMETSGESTGSLTRPPTDASAPWPSRPDPVRNHARTDAQSELEPRLAPLERRWIV
jgi:hypothetical protein